MASGSLFSESPASADKTLARAIERSLEGGDISLALDSLGEAPGLIYDRELALNIVGKLSIKLAQEQLSTPSPQAARLVVVAQKDPLLEERLSYDIRQRLVRRLRRWQTGPGAARQLACDIYEAALVDMAASQLSTNPSKLESIVGKKNFTSLKQEMKKRKFLKGNEKLGDNLERWDWIAIIDEVSEAENKSQFADDLHQGIRRFYELPARDRILVSFDVAEEDPDWQAN